MLLIPANLVEYTLVTDTQLRVIKTYEATKYQVEEMQQSRGVKFWE